MTHPLVSQLRFARNEFLRGLDGVSEEDGQRRLMPMNCISWVVGHLSLQEQYLWVYKAQGKIIVPELLELVGTGRPASTPPLGEMWANWRAITAAADVYLDTVSAGMLGEYPAGGGSPARESVGTSLLRNTYHYWFHLGEALAIRQMLGHANLPEFVGSLADVMY